MDVPAEKPCNTCHEVKFLDQFSRDRSHADGRRSSCEECRHAKIEHDKWTKPPNCVCILEGCGKAFYMPPALKARNVLYCSRAHRDIGTAKKEGTEKVCKGCGGEPKPLSSFHKQKLGQFGVMSYCKDCLSAQRKAARLARGIKPIGKANVAHDPETGRLVSLVPASDRTRRCEQCGQAFSRPPSVLGPFCSMECYGLSRRRRNIYSCLQCGNPFETLISQYEAGLSRYCSTNCRDDHRRTSETITCGQCGKMMQQTPYERTKGISRFCSKKCYRTFQASEQLRTFWDYVDQSHGPDACWPWLGVITKMGSYGKFYLCHRGIFAHQMAFMLIHGAIPNGLFILHHCDFARCCNPWHLYAGTLQDNVRDRVMRNRSVQGERVWTAKLTDDAVRTIRELAGSMTRKSIAKQFNVSISCISSVIRYEHWKHIT